MLITLNSAQVSMQAQCHKHNIMQKKLTAWNILLLQAICFKACGWYLYRQCL